MDPQSIIVIIGRNHHDGPTMAEVYRIGEEIAKQVYVLFTGTYQKNRRGACYVWQIFNNLRKELQS